MTAANTRDDVQAVRAGDMASSILLAARRCFDRSGIAGTTVEEVSREIGVSRTTFYRHFPGIDAVIVKITIDEVRSLLESAIANSAGHVSWIDKLAGVVVGVTLQLSQNPWMQMMGAKGETIPTTIMVHGTQGAMRSIEAPLETMLEEGRRAGALDPSLDPAEGAEWLMRAAWSLSVVPSEPGWTAESLKSYAEKFVIRGLVSASTLFDSRNSPEAMANRKLDSLLISIGRIEEHLRALPRAKSKPGRKVAPPPASAGSAKRNASAAKKRS